MQLKYYVHFKAQEGSSAESVEQSGILPIEGIAIDASVNSNRWQVPSEDLDFFVTSLQGAQLRIDHGESVLAVVGKVPSATRVGDKVLFKGEVGEANIITKILRGYIDHVSVQVDSDDTECSTCKKQTRSGGLLVHLCVGAWEIVHKPKVRELSIVASPAYKNTVFKPVGFAAAMDAALTLDASAQDKLKAHIQAFKIDMKLLLQKVTDEGSNREVQEPDKKTKNALAN